MRPWNGTLIWRRKYGPVGSAVTSTPESGMNLQGICNGWRWRCLPPMDVLQSVEMLTSITAFRHPDIHPNRLMPCPSTGEKGKRGKLKTDLMEGNYPHSPVS